MVKSRKITCFFLLLVFWSLSLASSSFGQTGASQSSTYDGNVGKDKLILVNESSDSVKLSGYFVLNRGQALENSHTFSINIGERKPFFQSDLYIGPVKNLVQKNNNISGKLVLLNKKRRFIFWRQKEEISFARRPEQVIIPSERYQKEIFTDVEIKKDLLYGKAKGLWTSSPYTNEAYIEVLGKGLIKTFKDPEMLDLRMDIYYPKTDTFRSRPAVMLIHGGAFYIGSKESAAERSLATSLAKSGYLVASIDYRLGFKLTPGDLELSAYRAVQDAHAALRFLAHNATGLGIDPTQIYVGGTSAGAVASLNVTFMDNDERPPGIIEAEKDGILRRIEESGNKYTEKFEIKAVANMWGAVSDLNILDRDEKIPVLSIHGTADNIVPYEYDHPFKNALLVNRLLLNKMYGSKPIHDRLQILGIPNELVSLQGMGHEPELVGATRLNEYMDTITTRVQKFFYGVTSPEVKLPSSQLSVEDGSALKSVFYEVVNGNPVNITVEGGVKVSADPLDATFIWLKNREKRQINVLSTNKFGAWSLKSFPIRVF